MGGQGSNRRRYLLGSSFDLRVSRVWGSLSPPVRSTDSMQSPRCCVAGIGISDAGACSSLSFGVEGTVERLRRRRPLVRSVPASHAPIRSASPPSRPLQHPPRPPLLLHPRFRFHARMTTTRSRTPDMRGSQELGVCSPIWLSTWCAPKKPSTSSRISRSLVPWTIRTARQSLWLLVAGDRVLTNGNQLNPPPRPPLMRLSCPKSRPVVLYQKFEFVVPDALGRPHEPPSRDNSCHVADMTCRRSRGRGERIYPDEDSP